MINNNDNDTSASAPIICHLHLPMKGRDDSEIEIRDMVGSLDCMHARGGLCWGVGGLVCCLYSAATLNGTPSALSHRCPN